MAGGQVRCRERSKTRAGAHQRRRRRRREGSPSSPGWISGISALIAALVGAIGLLVATTGGDSAPPATTETEPTQEALAPASVPPEVAPCDEPLLIAVTGGASPLTCDDGSLNVRAWRHYAELDPFVMRLDRDSTPGEVSRALCSDIERSATTTSLETEAYLLPSTYYGWNFVLDPIDGFPDYC